MVFYVEFLMLAVRAYGMLLAMQQSIETAPASATPDFAGLLAALAAPAHESETRGDGSTPMEWKPSAAWNEDGLEDDIATLSYERALKAHARYRAIAAAEPQFPQFGDPEVIRFAESLPEVAEESPRSEAGSSASPGAGTTSNPAANRLRARLTERNLKDASVTIRMSSTECEQLHRRASESGLTVSAYLRSCTFEAESLRAMVKETLSQLRAATNPEKPASRARRRLGGLSNWLARLLTPWRGNPRAVRA